MLPTLPPEIIDQVADIAPWSAINALLRTCKRLSERDIAARHLETNVNDSRSCISVSEYRSGISISMCAFPGNILHGQSSIYHDTKSKNGRDSKLFEITYRRGIPVAWRSNDMRGTRYLGNMETGTIICINHTNSARTPSLSDQLTIWYEIDYATGEIPSICWLFSGTVGRWVDLYGSSRYPKPDQLLAWAGDIKPQQFRTPVIIGSIAREIAKRVFSGLDICDA